MCRTRRLLSWLRTAALPVAIVGALTAAASSQCEAEAQYYARVIAGLKIKTPPITNKLAWATYVGEGKSGADAAGNTAWSDSITDVYLTNPGLGALSQATGGADAAPGEAAHSNSWATTRQWFRLSNGTGHEGFPPAEIIHVEAELTWDYRLLADVDRPLDESAAAEFWCDVSLGGQQLARVEDSIVASSEVNNGGTQTIGFDLEPSQWNKFSAENLYLRTWASGYAYSELPIPPDIPPPPPPIREPDNPYPVPEPASVLLAGLGLAGAVARRKGGRGSS